MDFDPRLFKRAEYAANLRSLGFHKSEAEITELLGRSTKNTRRGHEFSFRPNGYEVGWIDSRQCLHTGFQCNDISPLEMNPSAASEKKASSFWFRFHRSEQVLLILIVITHILMISLVV
jgi:hypothetical protein